MAEPKTIQESIDEASKHFNVILDEFYKLIRAEQIVYWMNRILKRFV